MKCNVIPRNSSDYLSDNSSNGRRTGNGHKIVPRKETTNEQNVIYEYSTWKIVENCSKLAHNASN
jgi:hypothetical protein